MNLPEFTGLVGVVVGALAGYKVGHWMGRAAEVADRIRDDGREVGGLFGRRNRED